MRCFECSAVGPLPTLRGCVSRQRRAGAGCGAYPRRPALRSGSPAVLGPAAPSRNSLRSLRSLRSDTRDESVHESRCARGPRALRSSAPPMRATASPSPPLQTIAARNRSPGTVPSTCRDGRQRPVARRNLAGLRQSGGPWSEVKEEPAQCLTQTLACNALAGDMSGRGHPTAAAQGSSQHADGRMQTTEKGRKPPSAATPREATKLGARRVSNE